MSSEFRVKCLNISTINNNNLRDLVFCENLRDLPCRKAGLREMNSKSSGLRKCYPISLCYERAGGQDWKFRVMLSIFKIQNVCLEFSYRNQLYTRSVNLRAFSVNLCGTAFWSSIIGPPCPSPWIYAHSPRNSVEQFLVCPPSSVTRHPTRLYFKIKNSQRLLIECSSSVHLSPQSTSGKCSPNPLDRKRFLSMPLSTKYSSVAAALLCDKCRL